MAAGLNTKMSGIITGSSDDAIEIWRDIQKQLGAECNIEHLRAANAVSHALWDDRGAIRWLARHAMEATRPVRITIWSKVRKNKAH